MFEIIEAWITGKSGYLIYNGIVGVLGVLFNITTLLFKFKPMYNDYVRKEVTLIEYVK